MVDRNATNDAAAPSRDPDDDEFLVDAIVEEFPSGSTQCTLYPTEATETELETTWITARGDSYVDLALKR